MKMKASHYFHAIVLALAVFAISCTKDDNPVPSGTPDTAPTPTFTDGYGALAAVQTTTYVTVAGMTIPTEVNTAVAVFPETFGSTKYLDAGAVTLNNKALKKYENNAYVYENILDPLTFSTLKWDVAGNGSVPAISTSVTKTVPQFSGFSLLPSEITKSSGLTLNLAGQLSGADSLYVMLLDLSKGSVLKRLKGNATSVVFSAADLANISTGQGILEIIPWNFTTQTFSGKKYYFVNESAYVKSGITIK